MSFILNLGYAIETLKPKGYRALSLLNRRLKTFWQVVWYQTYFFTLKNTKLLMRHNSHGFQNWFLGRTDLKNFHKDDSGKFIRICLKISIVNHYLEFHLCPRGCTFTVDMDCDPILNLIYVHYSDLFFY